MKLISKFHDYYDSVLAQGRDESIVYVRERKEQTLKMAPDLVPWEVADKLGRSGPSIRFVKDVANPVQHPAWYNIDNREDVNQWRYDEAFVILAGQAHSVWVRYGCAKALIGAEGMSPSEAPLGDVEMGHVAKTMEAYLKTVKTLKPAEVVVKEATHRYYTKDEDRARMYEQARGKFLERDFTQLHIDLGAPVLLLACPASVQAPRSYPMLPGHRRTAGWDDNVHVVVNPILNDLNFQRAMDPFTCFQNISQFIGGVIPGKQMPMVQISDRYMVQKKGFDPVYGFRTRPSGK